MIAAPQTVYFLFSGSSNLSVREIQLCIGLQEGIVDPQLSSSYMEGTSILGEERYRLEVETDSEMMQGGSARS